MAEYYNEGFWETAGTNQLDDEDRLDPAFDWLTPSRSSTIVEIGCEPGLLIGEIKRRSGCTAIGIEPSVMAAQEAATVADRVIVGGWQNLPAEQVDGVVLSHVLEHLYDPDAALTHIRAALKPTGTLYVEVPNVRAPTEHKRLSRWLTRVHFWYFSPASLRFLLARNGFRVVKERHDRYVRFLATPGEATVAMPNERLGVWASLARHEALYWPRYTVRRIAAMF